MLTLDSCTFTLLAAGTAPSILSSVDEQTRAGGRGRVLILIKNKIKNKKKIKKIKK